MIGVLRDWWRVVIVRHPSLDDEKSHHPPTRGHVGSCLHLPSINLEATKRAAEADKRLAIAEAVAEAKREAARDAAEEMTRALAEAANASEKATRSAVVQAVNDARKFAPKEVSCNWSRNLGHAP